MVQEFYPFVRMISKTNLSTIIQLLYEGIRCFLARVADYRYLQCDTRVDKLVLSLYNNQKSRFLSLNMR
jgi:hypothetical protein